MHEADTFSKGTTSSSIVHRPSSVADRTIIAMDWHDLLFAHWPIAPDVLRSRIPQALELDTFDGHAWIAVVPFRMRNVRLRWLPPIPGTAAFPELNVRTYVRYRGEPGVWFWSLDAGNPLAVETARLTFHLPYFRARMRAERHRDTVHYASERMHTGARPASFAGHYRPIGPVSVSTPGTLEHWLTERYRLFAANRRGQIWRGVVLHNPWPLQPAEAEFSTLRMTEQIGLKLPDTPPLLHFAAHVCVTAGPPQQQD